MKLPRNRFIFLLEEFVSSFFDMSSCEQHLQELLQNYREYQKNPQQQSDNKIFQLFEKLETSNIDISCRKCKLDGTEGTARAFLSNSPFQITLCTNRLSVNDIDEALSHELTHAYDYYYGRTNFDTCEGLAYSEIRAAKNGECANVWEPFKQYCVKKYATRATSNLYPRNAKECVKTAWEQAYKDLEPSK